MPTVRQLFALLREDVEKEAIEETRKFFGEDECDSYLDYGEISDVSTAIKVSFGWENTNKGFEYWSNISNNPPLKQQPHA